MEASRHRAGTRLAAAPHMTDSGGTFTLLSQGCSRREDKRETPRPCSGQPPRAAHAPAVPSSETAGSADAASERGWDGAQSLRMSELQGLSLGPGPRRQEWRFEGSSFQAHLAPAPRRRGGVRSASRKPGATPSGHTEPTRTDTRAQPGTRKLPGCPRCCTGQGWRPGSERRRRPSPAPGQTPRGPCAPGGGTLGLCALEAQCARRPAGGALATGGHRPALWPWEPRPRPLGASPTPPHREARPSTRSPAPGPRNPAPMLGAPPHDTGSSTFGPRSPAADARSPAPAQGAPPLTLGALPLMPGAPPPALGASPMPPHQTWGWRAAAPRPRGPPGTLRSEPCPSPQGHRTPRGTCGERLLVKERLQEICGQASCLELGGGREGDIPRLGF